MTVNLINIVFRGDICVTGEHQSPIDVPLPSSKVKVSAETPFLKLPMQYFVMVIWILYGYTTYNNYNKLKFNNTAIKIKIILGSV